ncbi:hypothetical protein B0I35DRAFT_185662 [Stachybotrys elegans]|uniref:Mid2 domain-containing protein n=1 Tax=Stachybotrys elegans TaxID=80388 RepID=A0A8K0STK2_9HYPO|nr:hypothetical protein B0I35DRAFT_185662 [Stachybotrys elegans]
MLPNILMLALAVPAVFADAGQVSTLTRSTVSSSPLTLSHIRKRLVELGAEKRDQVFSNSTSLEKSFTGATLFKAEFANDIATRDVNSTDEADGQAVGPPIATVQGVEIVCANCYTRGRATASLTINNNFNASGIFNAVEEGVSNTMDQLVDWIKDIDIDLSELELNIPAPNISFNVDMAVFPECVLEFQFDEMELYVELDTTFSSGLTYELNMFKSTQLGIELGLDFLLGVVFSIDLILSVDSEIILKSGFHIQLDDGALLRLALFSDETTDMIFNGGKFEFLPVTVESAGAVFRAVLQLSLRSGFSLTTPDLTPGFNIEIGDFNADDWSASAGLETRVYANIAELLTNVTVNPEPEDDGCINNVVQEYTFGVGAAAGATVRIGEQIWGPTPATEVAIFFTTLAEACAFTVPASELPAPTPTPSLQERAPQDSDEQSLTVVTISRKETYTAVACASTELRNCPASLQVLRENVVTETLVTSVPSGVEAVWPETTGLTAASRVEFGEGVADMVTLSGRPETYTPPPSPEPEDEDSDDNDDGEDSNSIEDVLEGETGGVNNGLIIGLSVGLGVPFLIAIVAGIIFWRRRAAAKYSLTATGPAAADMSYTGAAGVKQEIHVDAASLTEAEEARVREPLNGR